MSYPNDTFYSYAVAIDCKDTPKKFKDFIECFAPRWSLSCGVHVLTHTKKLELHELRELVRATLPEGTSYWIAVSPVHEFVPNQKADAEK